MRIFICGIIDHNTNSAPWLNYKNKTLAFNETRIRRRIQISTNFQMIWFCVVSSRKNKSSN